MRTLITIAAVAVVALGIGYLLGTRSPPAQGPPMPRRTPHLRPRLPR